MPATKKKDNALQLIVATATSRDAGRGIVRLAPDDMTKIEVEIGDIVEIQGERNTPAKAMPAYLEDRDKGQISLDGLIRANADVAIGDKVAVRKATCVQAKQINLRPVTAIKRATGDKESRYLGRLLEGLAVRAGDTVRANLFGAHSQDFTVTSTVPRQGVVLVHPQTRITVQSGKGTAKAAASVSYEDLGGLAKEVRRVREMIELPLRHPQVFERLGIEPPKGVLLHGPAGTGKTLLARAVAAETDAHFVHVAGPEIMAKYYGEAEANVRDVFETARSHAPSIIFLDEIDAIAPKRAEVTGEVEKRVVAQLLALMDGLESRGQVIVIGASNVPENIDPALRRPGRFDREIVIGVPDKPGRREILDIHTRGMPLAANVELDAIAGITHGFVGADLEALCREAAMACLRDIFPDIDFASAEIPYDRVLELEVTMTHFTEAMKEVQPSAMREVLVEVPDISWDDIADLTDVKRSLVEAVEWPLKYSALFQASRTRPPRGILLYGPPGSGKTLLAKALASQTEVNFISVKGPELLSKWVGESEKGVRKVFQKARQAAPCIVFFDEMDALTPMRGSGGSHVTERVISQLLTELDGVEELRDVFVLAATNRRDLIDPALLRPGRFDLLLELSLPDETTRRQIFQIHTRDKTLKEDVDLADLARRTDDWSGAEIAAVCHAASLAAIRSCVEQSKGEPPMDLKGFSISKAHFDSALKATQAARR